MISMTTGMGWGARILRLATGLGLAIATHAAAGETPQSLILTGGDHIHGDLGSVDAEHLEWRRADLKAPIRFDLATIRRIVSEPENTLPDSQLRVRLTNGDDIPCTVSALDAKTLTVQTAFAGTIAIPRDLVKSVQMPNVRRNTGLLANVSDLGGFRQSGGNWEIKNGVLKGTGGIIYQTVMPERAYVSVDVQWTGDEPDFSVITHANNSSYYHYGYNAYISNSSVSLNRGTRQNFGDAKAIELPANKRMTLELLVDRAKGEVEVIINHRKVNKWTTGYDSRQAYLAFAVNGNSAVSFSNLHIEPLDEDRTANDNASEHDQVGFGGGDRLTGTINGITDGTLALSTSYGDLKIPVDQVEDIAFSGKDPLRARLEKQDVQIHLPAGGLLTVALTGIDGDHLLGHSENYGEVKLDLSYITRIDFHIYDTATDDGDEVGATLPAQDEDGEVQIFEDPNDVPIQIQGIFIDQAQIRGLPDFHR